MIVESNDGVPSVLTNFRGCRKSKVCERYAKHSWLIGHTCVYITNDPDKPNANKQWLVDTGKVVCGAVSALLGGLMYAPWKWPYKRVFTKSIYVSVPVSLALGFIAPMLVNRGVVIFDDITLDSLFVPKDGAAKSAPYTDIPFVVNAGYNGRSYRGWIQVVVSSNEGILLLQRDMNTSKYGYESFPTASAEELQRAIKEYIKEKLRENKKAGIRTKSSEKNFPPPTVDEIERAVERYGEWWGRSIRFWILPFNNNDAGFYKRMRSAELAPEDIGKLAAELDLMCASGPAPLIGSPPIDVSEFNEAFALIGGKGPLEDAVRGLYGNNKVVDVHHFPRRLLHSVMYSLVTTKPVANFAETLEVKLAEVTKRNAVPLTPFRWDLSDVLLTPLERGLFKRKTFIEWLTGKGNPSLSEAREEPHQTERQEKKGTQDH